MESKGEISNIYLHSFFKFIVSLEFLVLPFPSVSLGLFIRLPSVKLIASSLLIDSSSCLIKRRHNPRRLSFNDDWLIFIVIWIKPPISCRFVFFWRLRLSLNLLFSERCCRLFNWRLSCASMGCHLKSIEDTNIDCLFWLRRNRHINSEIMFYIFFDWGRLLFVDLFNVNVKPG